MALAATRALGSAGVPVAVLAENRWAAAWRSKFCIEAIEAPDADRGPVYLDFLETLVRRRRYSGIFFCDDRTALQVGRQRQRFLPYLPFLLPEQHLLELATDKNSMMDFARDQGIMFPLTAHPASADEVEAAAAGMRFPLLVKGSGGFASRRLRVVETVGQARAAFTELMAKQGDDGYDQFPHLQEYVSGPIFSAIAVCRNGQPLALFMMRKLRTFPVWGGVCVEAESIADSLLEGEVKKFLERFHWHGVIEIEFVRDQRDGRYLMIEPSPDPNWGLDLAVASGFNVPYLAWRLMQGLDLLPDQCRFVAGKRFVWFLPEGVRYMLARPSSIVPMLLTLFNPRSASDLRQCDLGPLLHQIRSTWWAVRSGN